MTKDLFKAALDYHEFPVPGKISVIPLKATDTQEDLALCYTPGVAEPVKAIANNPNDVYRYTSKGNLIAVISNGTAILGLGNLGALASKPVMEGKGVLFKCLADVDVFDIEIDCEDVQEFIETVVRISPTFGGINLEDIKAPECFAIEAALCKRLNIPVLHDDQHGTAIIVAAGLLNALDLQEKKLSDAHIVFAGVGAAGIATAKLLLELGAKQDNLYMIDRTGVIHHDREDLNEYKKIFAIKTAKRSLADALINADVFIGVSGPNVMTADMLKSMAKKPIVFALSNPIPEIMPELAHQIRQDLIIATGRSDYPNQVNNALCFPYLFRGALDARASCINEPMKLAAVFAIKELAREPVPSEMLTAYQRTHLTFGADYILPMLLDKRLKSRVASAVTQAAIASGVAQME